MKKSFTLLELIFIILIISTILLFSLPKQSFSKLKLAKEQLIIHLQYTRYMALLDNKYDHNDQEWYKKRWTLKIQNCRQSVGGYYYIIYNDIYKNNNNEYGSIKKIETLKDPLTNQYLYMSNSCKQNSSLENNLNLLLTEKFGVDKIEISCNATSTIGQISFGNDGNVYTKLSDDSEDYRLDEKCFIDLYDKNNRKETITIEPKTGYIH